MLATRGFLMLPDNVPRYAASADDSLRPPPPGTPPPAPPVVITDLPGGREAVRVSGMGEVVRARDTLALAQGLARVIKSRADYVKPREEIRRLFSFERTMDGYEDLFRDAVQRRQSG